ncbi:hypothetical protein IGI04_026029 [Brassica rapa subsp. trilocularis]|uniref:Uncharacterized protein n=1 Tax=Brassica rapa subsp. trilocularis TaxID=1813537 RepID=A0ABQ7KUS0_BRACM|nr:hypothetical protein IGI04_026029 [Brassica rapa subsp. trilocularis]
MAHNNTLISNLTESSNNVEAWEKNTTKRHLIVAHPNHYFGYFDDDIWSIQMIPSDTMHWFDKEYTT